VTNPGAATEFARRSRLAWPAMAATRSERATSFGAVAENYDRYRPAPPAVAAEWLLPPGSGRVADVGAGTGGFSRVLADHVPEVVAVELDIRMAAFLASRSPGVAVVNAKGESLPLRSASLDAVLVSSAWHWFDAEVAVPEIARVLRPGGVLGVLWNGPARRVDWVAKLLGRDRQQAGDGQQGGRHTLQLPDGSPFAEPETRVFEWSLPRTPSELIGLAGTYSGVITLAPGDRLAVARRATEVVEQHPLLRGRTSIDLPMGTRCWRAIRLPNPPAG
jgi:SAM-dependent methyltransferase